MKPSLVEVEGDNYQMGYQYGKKCREIIKKTILLNYRITKFYTGLSREECIKNVERFIPYIKSEVPHLYDEMKGIADGSSLPLEDIIVLNFHARDLVGGCTLTFVNADSTEYGKAIIAETIDWNPLLLPYYHVLHLKPDNGPEILQFTLAGILGLIGKNSNDLNIFMNLLLTSEKIEPGIPAYLVLRLLMEQKNATTAVKVLKKTKRASPFNYLISDSEGKTYDIETSPNYFIVDEIKEKFYVHTNHCLYKPLSSYDVYVQLTGSDETIKRYERMRSLLKSKLKEKKITVGDLMNLYKDHQNYPDSICRHPRENVPDEGKMCTIGLVISIVGDKGLWVVCGNPCKNNSYYFSFQ